MKAVLFDHDGTLINSEAIHFDLWQRFLSHYGVSITSDYYNEQMAGVSVRENAPEIIKAFNLPLTPQALFEGRRALTLDYLSTQAFPLMPGAKEVLWQCYQQGIRVAIVTGGARASVERTLKDYGLSKWVECVVSSDDVATGKPAPDCYLKALRLMELSANEAVAVEDTGFGVASAVAAGVACVAIPTPLSSHHDFSAARAQYACLLDWFNQEIGQS